MDNKVRFDLFNIEIEKMIYFLHKNIFNIISFIFLIIGTIMFKENNFILMIVSIIIIYLSQKLEKKSVKVNKIIKKLNRIDYNINKVIRLILKDLGYISVSFEMIFNKNIYSQYNIITIIKYMNNLDGYGQQYVKLNDLLYKKMYHLSNFLNKIDYKNEIILKNIRYLNLLPKNDKNELYLNIYEKLCTVIYMFSYCRKNINDSKYENTIKLYTKTVDYCVKNKLLEPYAMAGLSKRLNGDKTRYCN